MAALFSGLFNSATLVVRFTRGLALGAAAVGTAVTAATGSGGAITWGPLVGIFATAFFGGFLGAGEPNKA